MAFLGSENYKITKFRRKLQRKQLTFRRSYLSEYLSDENRSIIHLCRNELSLHNTINHIDPIVNGGGMSVPVSDKTA